MENGYHLYTFSGHLLREEPIDQFKQWAWRPRPERLLSKEEQKNVRKNLREYSRQFEEADLAKKSSADKAVVDQRRRLLEEMPGGGEERTEGGIVAGSGVVVGEGGGEGHWREGRREDVGQSWPEGRRGLGLLIEAQSLPNRPSPGYIWAAPGIECQDF